MSLNRIYQGRVNCVEIKNPGKEAPEEKRWLLYHGDLKTATELTARIPPLREQVKGEIESRSRLSKAERDQTPKSNELKEYERLRDEQRKAWESALWEHHQLFQDAVNYYTVAIAALAASEQSPLMALRRLLSASWDAVEKQGERRDGLALTFKRILQRDAPPTLADVVEWIVAPLDAAGVEPMTRELAGESLLYDLGGPGSIQRSNEYWYYFCQSGFKKGVQFPRAPAELLKERTAKKLPPLLRHGRIAHHTELMKKILRPERFANADKRGAVHDAAESTKLLKNAVAFFRNKLTEDESRQLETEAEKTHSVRKIVGTSINKTPLKTRYYAFLIFKHLASNARSLARLAECYPPPSGKSAKRKEPTEKEKIEIRLCSLGIDPIEAVRKKSRIVFRAFTAMPAWQMVSTGSQETPPDYERSNFESEMSAGSISCIGWKDFDIAAFKEAMTVINQFNQNVKKREDKLNEFATKLLVMDGERVIEEYNGDGEVDRKIRSRLQGIWATQKGKPKLPQPDEESEGEATVLPSFANDPRVGRLREIVSKELAEEYRLTEGRTTPYGLRRRTMKGWNDVKRKWQGILTSAKKRTGEEEVVVPFSDELKGELQNALNELRKSKSEQIGSHKLFEALIASEASWGIWREPTDKEAEKIDAKGWARDPLEAFRLFCETRETLEDLTRRPLNFTPADARRSRRLLGFKEVCSFGKPRGEFKHDSAAMAVTVPLVCKNQQGVYKETPIRLSYSAPRFLRDQIRSSEGHYAQKWIQPMVEALCPAQTELPRQQLEDAAVELMPDWDKDDKHRFLLNFSFELQADAISALFPRRKIWIADYSEPEILKRFNRDKPVRANQFVAWDGGEVLTFLRWPLELERSFEVMKKHKHWRNDAAGYEKARVALSSAEDDEARVRVVRDFLSVTNQQGEGDKDKKRRLSVEYALLSFEKAWWRNPTLKKFHALSADLGTRHGATVARIEVSDNVPAGPSTARFIGDAGGRKWFGRHLGGKVLRLPGEDAEIVRHQNEQDLVRDPKGEAKRAEKDFREELHGDRGRLANDSETRVFFDMLKDLEQLELLPEKFYTTDKLPELRRHLSFPEQNDKLLIAMRWTQGHLADLISQHWRLVKPEKPEQTNDALQELKDQTHYPVLALMAADATCSEKLVKLLHERIVHFRQLVQRQLLVLTERILPVRGRAWEFNVHPDSANFPDCHLLQSVQRDSELNDKLLRGQRGISMSRIEQFSELRRRWQSLNQSLRRQIGERPLTAAQMRAKPIPDPCPTILKKLEEIREQRVNQIAHLTLAEALGLRLRIPEKGKKERRDSDIHGEYKRDSEPADFIVLEHLDRYKANQGRAKSENTRLMQWCHRQVVGKIKELAETFGIPVLETPAAYSSRFCSLTGAVGFRAIEVGLANRDEYRWRKLIKEAEEKGDEASVEAKSAQTLFHWLAEANGVNGDHAIRTGKEIRTLLAPQVGGPIFVTAVNVEHPAPNSKRKTKHDERCRKVGIAATPFWVLPIQADLGAAANLALRAVAHPDCTDVHHRVRSERVAAKENGQNEGSSEDTYQTRERRRFGENQQRVIPKDSGKLLPKERNPNLFYDLHKVAQFDRVRLEGDPEGQFSYATGRGIWKRVNDWEFQWRRCEELNKARGGVWNMKFTEIERLVEKK